MKTVKAAWPLTPHVFLSLSKMLIVDCRDSFSPHFKTFERLEMISVLVNKVFCTIRPFVTVTFQDLAARNILVDDNMVCKVADFGMSRELSEEETYNTTVRFFETFSH